MRQKISESAVGSTEQRRGPIILVSVLVLLVVVYIATLPWQRRLMAETSRLEALAEAERTRAAGASKRSSDLEAARSEVQQSPGDAEAHIRLARLSDQSGELADAAREARLAADLAKNNPDALMVLADIERRRKRYFPAVSAYKEVLARSPGNPQALLGLSSLYVSFGWPLEAEALLKPAVQAAPDNLYLKVGLALAYLQHENYDAADHLLQEVRSKAPEDTNLWSPLLPLYTKSHRYSDAIKIADQILSRSANNVAVISEQGFAYYRLDDLPKAMDKFRQAISIQQDDLRSHYYLGICLERTNRIPEAIAELEYVLKRSPSFLQTRLLLGNLYLRANRQPEGRQLLAVHQRAETQSLRQSRASLVLAGNPNSPEAHWNMAVAYNETGDRPHAILEAQKTLELAPRHPAARNLIEKLTSKP